MSRHGPDNDRVTTARLCGTATRHARTPDSERDEAVAIDERVSIATERRPGRAPLLRVDLLSQAAGILIGGHRHNPSAGWSAPAAARLLLRAGADRDQAAAVATQTASHLASSTGGGIGSPSQTSTASPRNERPPRGVS